MKNTAPEPLPRKDFDMAEEVGAKVARKLKARKYPSRTVWSGLGMMGLVGWSIVVPTVMGAALGLWLDRIYPGRISWTLACMAAGLFLGCMNAWHWVAKEERAIHEDLEDENE